MTYCYRCPQCGWTYETNINDTPGYCAQGHDGVDTVRDYRAEAVGIGSGVRVSRDGLVSDQAGVFLPTNADYKGPGDPDGTKGMRAWRETHGPKADNKKPHWPGTVEKKVW